MGSVVCPFVNEAQGASSHLTHSKHGLLEVVRREAANTQGWPVPKNTKES